MVFQSRITHNDIQVRTDFAQAPALYCYSGELQQVFTNLIANSLDALPTGGTLALAVRPGHGGAGWSQEGIRVTIADSGSGMDRSTLTRAFEPFFTTKNDRGTGLGLWVSKGIVDKHHGTIRMASAQGRGTVISMFFPYDGLRSRKEAA